jgi:hypothetical protein
MNAHGVVLNGRVSGVENPTMEIGFSLDTSELKCHTQGEREFEMERPHSGDHRRTLDEHLGCQNHVLEEPSQKVTNLPGSIRVSSANKKSANAFVSLLY